MARCEHFGLACPLVDRELMMAFLVVNEEIIGGYCGRVTVTLCPKLRTVYKITKASTTAGQNAQSVILLASISAIDNTKVLISPNKRQGVQISIGIWR